MTYKHDGNFFEDELNETDKVWHYLNLAKFLSLISSSSMYFSSIPRLIEGFDAFEGRYPRENLSALNTDRFINHMAMEFSKAIEDSIFIKCWNLCNHESVAMWGQYTNKNEGIAIESTIKQLRDCFKKSTDEVNIGKVQYIDPDSDKIKVKSPIERNIFFYKRKSFDYEKEVRCLIALPDRNSLPETAPSKKEWENAMDTGGLSVSIDLDTLISKIYVSPFAPGWFSDVVKSVTSKYDLHKPVEISSIAERPLY